VSRSSGAVDRYELLLYRSTDTDGVGGAADVVDHLGVADDEWLSSEQNGSIGAMKRESAS